jgi:Trk K+ transport system NAD-binding subunit
LQEASLVILSTNDDAVNIYLSIYCRRLNPNVRIVSRITHERNLEAIHRAGADFVLSYAPLGAESIISLIQGRPPIIMGEGVELFTVRLPSRLAGKTLAESRIGALTGLIVLAIRTDEDTIASPPPWTVLPKNCRLSMLGTSEQLQSFINAFS